MECFHDFCLENVEYMIQIFDWGEILINSLKFIRVFCGGLKMREGRKADTFAGEPRLR